HASSRPRSTPGRTSSATATRFAPSSRLRRAWRRENPCPRLRRARGEGGRPVPRSLPFQRSLPPFIDKPDCQNGKEHDHGKETEQADMGEGNRPRKQERDFEIEDDEQDGDEIEPHIEFGTGVGERLEATFI